MMNLNDMLQVICTAHEPLDRNAQPIWVYDFDEDELYYEEIEWDNKMVFFKITPLDYKPEAYLKPKFAYAEVRRIWAIQGEPVKIGITLNKPVEEINDGEENG